MSPLGYVSTSLSWQLPTSAELQLAADLPEVIGRVSDIIKRLGHKLELFNACSVGSDRPARMKDAALDVNLELVRFLAVLVRFLRRDALSGTSRTPPSPKPLGENVEAVRTV